jgi:hypothetical protein
MTKIAGSGAGSISQRHGSATLEILKRPLKSSLKENDVFSLFEARWRIQIQNVPTVMIKFHMKPVFKYGTIKE